MTKEFQELILRTKSNESNPAKSEADVIRRAVALYAYLHEQLAANPGTVVCIRDAEGKIIQIVDPLP
jgi:hypothetical protein